MKEIQNSLQLNLVGLDDFGLNVHKNTLKKWYQLMHLGRLLDIKAANYLKQSKGWSYHAPFAGHDGIQLMLGLSFRPNKDFLFPYYRDMLTVLAAGITPEEIILNGLSKATDVASGGRHMSNHFAKPEIRIQNVSSCVANHALHAVGVARAIKIYGGDEIAYFSSGEASTSEGYFYEAVNGASREQVPVIFVIQNNKYGISVPIEVQSANKRISDNFIGFKNLHIVNVDGTNPFDSWRGMQEAIDYVSSGRGPAMVHADCVRIHAHSNSDRHELYRNKEELEEVRRLDPLPRFRNYLILNEIFTEQEILEIEKANEIEVEEADKRAEAAPDPDPKTVYDFVVPKEIEFCPVHEIQHYENLEYNESQPKITLREAINETLKEEFRNNPNTFLWGQDVASKDKGGVFNVTKGMLQEFGEKRIFNAPLAEDFIVGTAEGFSRYRDDIVVVVEGAQFADYFWPAMEQLIELSHDYWRSYGKFVPNVVIRLASGGYIGGGLYHSQNLEAVFTSLPGLRVVVPAFADDAVGLLKCAMRNRGVTLYLEPKFLYNQPFAATPRPPKHFCFPFGKARIRRKGQDLSIITYGTTVHWALRAAKRLKDEYNVETEVLDLRSLAPLDKTAIFETVKKTGKVLVVHEDKVTGGFGGEVAAIIAEYAFEYLDAPIMRVGSKDTPVGFSKILENAILPQVDDIFNAAVKLAKY